MRKLLAFFGTADEINALHEKGYCPHIQLGKVPVEKIHIITLPTETNSEKFKPLRIDKETIPNATLAQQVILLNIAICKSTQSNRPVHIKIWKNADEREHGTPTGGYSFDTICNTLDDPNHPAAELLAHMYRKYGIDGCAEIIICDENGEEYPVYHEDYEQTYLLPDIFEFIG